VESCKTSILALSHPRIQPTLELALSAQQSRRHARISRSCPARSTWNTVDQLFHRARGLVSHLLA